MTRADVQTCASGDETGIETYVPPKILLLDDDARFLNKISEGVEKAIFKLQTALDLSTGLLYACNESYDAILINYEMLRTKEERLMFLEDIKGLPGYKNIPISVLLPVKLDDTQEAVLKQQFSSVLLRSSDIKEITHHLLSLISGSFDRYTTLIVSGSQTVCDVLGKRLEAGFRVLCTTNPSEAIELVYQERPDILMLDHSLENNGCASVCRQIRGSSRLHDDTIAVFGDKPAALLDGGVADFVVDTREQDAKLISFLTNAASEYKDRLRTRTQDPLTGLPLRNKLLQYLIPRLHFRSNAEQKLDVVIFDIDSLKDINTEYGYDEGDELIRRLSNYLQQTFSHQYVYNWGSDDFMIVSDVPDSSFAEKIQQAQANFESFKFGDGRQPVRLNVGKASYPQDSKSATGLVNIALDRVKNSCTKVK